MRQIPLPVGVAGALRMSGPAEQLRWLLEEHDKLLARVGRKRQQLEQLEQAVRAAVTRVACQLAPIEEETCRLDEAIHSRLEALAAAKQRPRRERDQIRRLHRDLQRMGLLSPRQSPAPGGDDASGPEDHPYFEQDVAAAPPVPDRGAIRDLFRRLAEALHPDKVQDEESKAARTEAMKEITVAYREGDFARLVEIERNWATSLPIVSDGRGDDVERRQAAALQANRELKKQLRELERELRWLRNSDEGRLASALGQGKGALASVVGPAEEDLETLRRVHDFVEAFAAGKISLAELLAGPQPSEQDDFAIFEEALAEMASMLEEERVTRSRGKSRKRGRAKRRA